MLVDDAARRHAVDPLQNVVLEASAGTGKTRVLVERYVNLLRAGVDPDHILAITFTRKAAAEMRERVVDRLREASRLSQVDLARWRDLKDRLSDIEISTIDAFCLSLLREFPLEAGVDPGFELADDTQAPRLIDEALDQALRICRRVARDDDDVALVFAQLGERRLRVGLGALLDRRLVAPNMLARYLDRGPRDLTAGVVCWRAAERLRESLATAKGGIDRFLSDGPMRRPQFAMLARDIARLCGELDRSAFEPRSGQAALRVLVDRLRAYFLTLDGRPREKNFTGTGFNAAHCDSEQAWRRHRQTAVELAPQVAEAIRAFRRDLNVVLSRGVWRMFAVTLRQYQRTLDSRALLDFSGVLERAVALLENMEEFAQSRYRLEARYRHVLVDEFQDTSRAQWQLVAELVRSWGEGVGAGGDSLSPSIFIVGDRKQSIYGFRDADAAILDEAARFVEGLRPDGTPRRAISVSFRGAPPLLAFINDLFTAIAGENDGGGECRPREQPRPPARQPRWGGESESAVRNDRFRYEDHDRFPIDGEREVPHAPDLFDVPTNLGIVVGDSATAAAEAVAVEIERLLQEAVVRDRVSLVSRAAQPADIAILFRSRDSHREFEKALGRKGVSTYVYKGLGFFDADEVQDAVALLRYLADPTSDLRAAALLRSRIVRLSDPGVARLAPRLAQAVLNGDEPAAIASLGDEDRSVLTRLREAVPRWMSHVDRMTPSELLTTVLAETAYAYETRGAGRRQARENLKKVGGMIRRFQNRGYATLGRVADHLGEMAAGDESNAAIDARDAVSLMTVHAAKGLEFPIVFVVNMGRGTGGIRPPIRIASDARGEASVAIADFQSEADEDAQARDREETKRLLYVALTRARDCLYLSATVEGGVCRTGRGSLGDVLPAAVKALFTEASACGSDGGIVTWRGSDRHVHRFVARSASQGFPATSF
jgi:ATP-dependent helicase/nuclease subunit A